MFDPRNIQLYSELIKEAEEKVAVDPSALKLLLAGLGGGAAIGVPGYLLMDAHAEAVRKHTRDRAFGAGVATGLAGPKIVSGLANIAKRTGFLRDEPMVSTGLESMEMPA